MFDGIIKGLKAKAAEVIKAEEGDYIHGGLLHCGKCNTPKQVKVELPWGTRTPMCLCKCMAEKRDREEAEAKRKQFEDKIKRYRQLGFPESQMEHWTFANADGSNAKQMEAMQRYVDNFDDFLKKGQGLLLYGTVGLGKTYAAACIANALIDRGCPALMTKFERIANTVFGMGSGKQEYYDELCRYPLLCLDDLAAERKTEYMQEIVYNIIDGRYRAKLPLIVTTNLTLSEIANPADITYQRTFSRLLEMCVPVKFEGSDKRLINAKSSINEARGILGL